MIYFLSDPHFGHFQILQYEPRRQIVLGTTIEEHDAALLARINSKVKPDDVLIITGDFSLSDKKSIQEYRQKILCRTVIIVLGNHDKRHDYYKLGFQGECYEMVLRIANEYVRLRHHPYRKPWYRSIFPWQFKEKDRNKRPKDYGHFLVHGHTHSRQANKVQNKSINVGIDCWNFYPVSIKEIESIISRKNAKKFKMKGLFLSYFTKLKRKIRMKFIYGR